MQKAQLVIPVLLLILLLVSCAPQVAPTATPVARMPAPALSPTAPAAAGPAKPAWEEKWEETLAAAKAEGRLALSSSLGGEQRQLLTKPFESKYGVRIESMSGQPAQLTPKILAEQRAGIYSWDVWVSGTGTYLAFKDAGALDRLDPVLILPELTEPELIKKTWYFGELSWADKAHTSLIGLMSANEVICTNTNLVKAGELTSYQDLLNPKWKGQISIQDPRISTMGLHWFAVALEVGDVDINFMRELSTKQEIFITRDPRLQVEWLARGKHAITIGPSTAAFTEFMQLGAPVARFSLGTPFVSGATSGIAMIKRQPHPNAAKLFINWLLSQEGATIHSQTIGAQSQRLDVPTTHLEPSKVLKPGLKLYRSDNEEFTIKRYDFYIKLAKEVFGAY